MYNHYEITVGDNVYVVGSDLFDPSFPNRVIMETGHFLRVANIATVAVATLTAHWVKRSQCYKAQSESVLGNNNQERNMDRESDVQKAIDLFHAAGYRVVRQWDADRRDFDDVIQVLPRYMYILDDFPGTVTVDAVNNVIEKKLSCGFLVESFDLPNGLEGCLVTFFDPIIPDEKFEITEEWHQAVDNWIICWACDAADSSRYNDKVYEGWYGAIDSIANAVEMQEAVWVGLGLISPDIKNRFQFTNDTLWVREHLERQLNDLGFTTFAANHDNGLMVWDSEDLHLTVDNVTALLVSLGYEDVLRGVGKTDSTGILVIRLR